LTLALTAGEAEPSTVRATALLITIPSCENIALASGLTYEIRGPQIKLTSVAQR
jgi:hypothetical protein